MPHVEGDEVGSAGLDSLTYAVGGNDENNAQVALNCMETANYIAQELGCAVIIVHHLNKNGDGRGSYGV